MSYLPINIAGARLLIDGVDYSNELVSFNVSDDSAISSSLLTTNGQVVLAQSSLGKPVNDYLGKVFTKGKKVLLDIKQPNGEYVRHPRGHLYILTSSYDLQEKQLTIEVGCGLAYAAKYEDQAGDFIKNLFELFAYNDLVKILPSLPLTPTTQEDSPYDLQYINDVLQVDGNCIYQDRWGYIQKVNIFGEDGFYATNANVPYKFTSYDTYTCLSIESQAETGSQVDKVEVTADTSVTGTNGDPEDEEIPEDIQLGDEFLPYATDEEFDQNQECDPGQVSNQQTKEEDRKDYYFSNPAFEFSQSGYEPFIKNTVTTTTIRQNLGPGNQVNLEISYTVGNVLARNSSDFSTFVNGKVSQGDSVTSAVSTAWNIFYHYIITDASQTIYEYGKGGELVRKTTRTYGLSIDKISDEEKQTIAASIFSNSTFNVWLLTGPELDRERSVGGPVNRQEVIDYTYNLGLEVANPEFFLNSRNIRNGFAYNEEVTTVWDYVESGTTGSTGYSRSVRRSGGNLVNPAQQDYIPPEATDSCAPANQTTEEVELFESAGVEEDPELEDDALSELDFESSKDVERVDFPIELPPAKSLEQLASYRDAISGYATTVYQKLAADSRGFTIQEALRAEFYSWYPGYPYRLVILSENRAFYMRISAATWTVTPNESVCSFESMLISEYVSPTIAQPSENSQFAYLLPEVVSPTTASNQLVNADYSLGVNVRTVSQLFSGIPAINTTPITTLPSVSAPFKFPAIKTGWGVTLQVRPRLLVKEVTPVPLRQIASTPVAVDFNVPVDLIFSSISYDFGSIGIPSSVSFDFAEISNPSAAVIEAGTILTPLI